MAPLLLFIKMVQKDLAAKGIYLCLFFTCIKYWLILNSNEGVEKPNLKCTMLLNKTAKPE